MNSQLDLKAIAVFCAIGFFLDEDTYFIDEKYEYSSTSSFAEKFNKFRDFKWHYHPREISLDDATEEFANLFEKIIKEQVGQQKVILPLSGGLDSRTQAVALRRIGNNASAYSYQFEKGHNEVFYAKEIAKRCNFEFKEFTVPDGYLWDKIDQLAKTNSCFSEFTHPRQMAFSGKYAELGDVFSMGHWGDVLFDGAGVADNLSLEEQVKVILKKIIKKGGLSLAEMLWQEWKLEGSFSEYLHARIADLLGKVQIEGNSVSSIRAFKSKYWATRWTASNFGIFENDRPITLPYFDTRMCEFVCTLPESMLNKRKIQINYIKRYAPDLASISWQEHRPFNLFNYHYNQTPWNLPYRIYNKLNRELSRISGNIYVQRNWELQFVGQENERKLKEHLFANSQFQNLVPESIIGKIYSGFVEGDAVQNSHPLSTLLTLSMFVKTKLQ